MISFFAGDPHDPALPVLLEAFRRSVTPGHVSGADGALHRDIAVFLAPREDQAALVAGVASRGGKALVFGRIGPAVAAVCGLGNPRDLPEGWSAASGCEPAPPHAFRESGGQVRWSDHGLAEASPYRSRPFLRFDFADEWNNMGYGRIRADGGPWAMAQGVDAGDAVVLAEAVAPGLAPVPMVTLRETPDGAVLWWNRPVGPVDSAEWAVVEAFLADWRAEGLAIVPVIEEVPYGASAAVTMRIDCDEDIASGRALFELYRARGVPFSVAVKTDQACGPADVALLRDIIAAGGAILSHSVTHAPNWGGSEDACAAEARLSSDRLEGLVPGLVVRNAVSPFHQNPGFVPAGLKRAGLGGFVGGIVANDPQMLLARGGTTPGDATGVVTHSQQCMLHGDCMLGEGDPLAVPKAAFRAARRSRTLFGYLDHPFSPRYAYGWSSEDSRLAAHAALLDFIADETAGTPVLRLNEDDALAWVARKARLRIERHGAGYRLGAGDAAGFGVRLAGRTLPLSEVVDG